MSRIAVWVWATVLASAASLPAQMMRGRGGPGCCDGGGPCAQASMSGSSVVEVKGKVARVQVVPGAGMPYVEVKAGSESTRVYLGPMRYLVTQNFNPKVDDEIAVKGYKRNGDIMAISASLPGQNKTLVLRDDSGCPGWCGGNRRRSR